MVLAALFLLEPNRFEMLRHYLHAVNVKFNSAVECVCVCAAHQLVADNFAQLHPFHGALLVAAATVVVTSNYRQRHKMCRREKRCALRADDMKVHWPCG